MSDKKVVGSRITPRTVSITFSGAAPVVIADDHPSFERIKAKVRSGDHTGLYELCSPAEGIKSYFGGLIQIKGGAIYNNGQVINHAIVPTILEMIGANEDPTHLLKFLALVLQNPSMHSRNQLWDFITKNGIVIYKGDSPCVISKRIRAGGTSVEAANISVDMHGFLVLYKGVRNDLFDQHTGKFLNEPGTLLEMNRAKVDDDQSAACSAGFHAGAYEYVKSFGNRKLLVLVNPADVVSVPHDSDAQKVRTCSYYVLEEVEGGDSFVELEGVTYDGKFDWNVTGLDTDGDMFDETVRAKSPEQATSEIRQMYDVEEIFTVIRDDA